MKAWRLGPAEYADEPDFATEVNRLRASGVDYSYHQTPEGALGERDGAAALVEVVFANSKVKLTRDWMAQLPSLRRIVAVTSGYDNVDLEAARERGIDVGRMPQIRTGAVVETTLWLILSLVRKGWSLASRMRLGGGDPWPRGMSREATRLADSTVGIIGQGEIGRALAVSLSGLTHLLVTDVRPPEECWPRSFREEHPEIARLVSWVPLDDMLARSDVVTLHVDLNRTSRRLIRPETLERMKPGTILVNTSRGQAVDEDALLARLDRLGGVGLDVFAAEPLASDHPLRREPNAVLLPHAAGSWKGMNEETIRCILEEIARLERGLPPIHPVRRAR